MKNNDIPNILEILDDASTKIIRKEVSLLDDETIKFLEESRNKVIETSKLHVNINIGSSVSMNEVRNILNSKVGLRYLSKEVIDERNSD